MCQDDTQISGLQTRVRRNNQETSPLIREQFDPTDRLAIPRPRKIQETTLTKVIRAVVKKAGLKETVAHNVKLTSQICHHNDESGRILIEGI